jgi:CheY-like chemotaxis protein
MADILYVEDNPDDADIFARLMSKLDRPITYTILGSGSEAVDYLSNGASRTGRPEGLPKLILLDLNLIGMTGFDVVQRIRVMAHTRWLPVVAFSTSDNPGDILEAYEAGVNAYLVKPGNYKITGLMLQRLCQFWLDDNTRIDS